MIQFLRFSPRALFLAGVVAAASADGQLLILAGMSVDMNRSEPPDIFRGRWGIGDGVLIADVVSDASADLIDFVYSGWEESYASGAVGQDFERPPSVSQLLSSEQANCVYSWTIFL